MNHHGVVAVQVLFPPDLLEKPLGADDLPPVLAEHPQDVELNGRQEQGPLVESTLVGLPVDDQPGKVDDVPDVGLGLVVPGGPPELGLDPGHQLQRIEGLGHIVVGPDGQAGDLVQVLHLGGEHDHREMVPLPDPPAEGEAVHAGHHHVQDCQVQRRFPDAGQRLPAVVELIDGVALVGQIQLHQVGDLLFVVHDQDVHFPASCSCGVRRTVPRKGETVSAAVVRGSVRAADGGAKISRS